MSSQQPLSTQLPQLPLPQPPIVQGPPQQPVQAPPVQVSSDLAPHAQAPPPQPAGATPLDPLAESLYQGGTNRRIECRHPDHNGIYLYFREGQEAAWQAHYRTHLGPYLTLGDHAAYCGYCSQATGSLRSLKEHIRDHHNTRRPFTLRGQVPTTGAGREIGRRVWA